MCLSSQSTVSRGELHTFKKVDKVRRGDSYDIVCVTLVRHNVQRSHRKGDAENLSSAVCCGTRQVFSVEVSRLQTLYLPAAPYNTQNGLVLMFRKFFSDNFYDFRKTSNPQLGRTPQQLFEGYETKCCCQLCRCGVLQIYQSQLFSGPSVGRFDLNVLQTF